MRDRMKGRVLLGLFLVLSLIAVKAVDVLALPITEYGVDGNTIALYHFNSSSGGLVEDSVGTHPGTLNGDAAITTGSGGYFGEGLLLDGSGDYVRLDNVHQDPTRITSQGTVELWVNLASVPSYFVLLGSGYEYGGHWDNGFFLGRHWDFGQDLMFGIWGSGWHYAHSSINPADLVGGWHHIAGTWGPEGVELWLDGNRVATNTYTGGLPEPNYATALVGTDAWTWDTPGVIDEVRISDIQRDFSPGGSSVPIPAAAWLLGSGLLGLLGLRRRPSA